MLSVLCVLFSLLPLASWGQLSSGGGVVFNPWTRQPVSDVKVTLVCDRLKRELLAHGSENVRQVTIVTNQRGEYFFSSSDVMGCDFAPLRAEKSGYVVIDSWYPEGCPFQLGADIAVVIAKHICMVERSQLAPTRIRYLDYQMTHLRDRWLYQHEHRTDPKVRDELAPPSNREIAVWRQVSPYQQVFRLFYEASALALSARERDAVKNEYCDVLRSMYQTLSGEEREFLAKRSTAPWESEKINIEGIGATWLAFDYEKEAAPVCERGAPPPGWNYGRAYGHYVRLVESSIGEQSERGGPATYRSRYRQFRVATKKLANGNIEEEYSHGVDRKCPTYFEIDAVTKLVVRWRHDGEPDDCGVLPTGTSVRPSLPQADETTSPKPQSVDPPSPPPCRGSSSPGFSSCRS